MNVEDSRIPLGPWLPDLPFHENPGLVEAKNCIPVDKYYAPYLPLTTTGDALTARVIGAFAALDTSGDTFIYAGIATALYLKNGTSWTDLGTVFTTSTTSYWRFAQFDTTVVATNFADTPQAIAPGASITAGLATSGTAPKGRQVGVINRFVVIGDTDYAGSLIPHRVQWSALANARDWPIPNTSDARTKQSGEQVLPAVYGAVTAIGSGEFFGLIFQRRAITKATYIGGDVVFQFQDYEKTRGCWFPQSMVQVGNAWYFIAADGFYMTDGSSVTPIGDGKFDKTFFADCDQTYAERVTGAYDYTNKCVRWSYPNFSATSGVPNRVLIYSTVDGRATNCDDTMEIVFASVTDGYTLDQLDALYGDLDSIPGSLDSPVFQGGANTLMGFGNDHRIGTYADTASVARFDTAEYDMNPWGYMFLRGVRPRVTGNPTGVTVAISSRENQDNTSRSFGTAVSRTTRTGVCDFRENVKFGSIRFEITGGFDKATGVDLDGEPGDGV
jgi:hypothetical protein